MATQCLWRGPQVVVSLGQGLVILSQTINHVFILHRPAFSVIGPDIVAEMQQIPAFSHLAVDDINVACEQLHCKVVALALMTKSHGFSTGAHRGS